MSKTKSSSLVPFSYTKLLEELKVRIRNAQVHAGFAANQEMIMLYWEIGCDILTRQKQEGWGAKVVDRLARDLGQSFPEMKGFTPRNLLLMRSLAEAYPDGKIVKQLVSQIPWGHNIRIVQAVKDPEERLWYIQKTATQRNCVVAFLQSKSWKQN